MRIVVCVKVVPDPEAPTEAYGLDGDGLQVVPGPGVKAVASTFDENAIESALQLREQHGGSVVALGLAPGAGAQTGVKRALHMGADEAVLVAAPGLGAGGALATAAALAAAIRKLGEVDLVLCGRQAADWDQGMVGVGIAAALDWPCVTLARRLAVSGEGLEVDRMGEEEVQTLSVPLPAVLTVAGELNTPRLTSAMAIMAAQRKRVLVWSATDVALDAEALAQAEPLELVRLVVPRREQQCRIIAGDTEEGAAVHLVDCLRAERAF